MSADECLYCHNKFTHLSEDELLLGRFLDRKIFHLKTYTQFFTEYGFRYRCKRNIEDKKNGEKYWDLISDLVLETEKDLEFTEVDLKISKYCKHVADYYVSKVYKYSPGLLLLLSRRCNLSFEDLDIHAKNIIGKDLYYNNTHYPTFIALKVAGFNFLDVLSFDNDKYGFRIIQNAIKRKDGFLTKLLLALDVNLDSKSLTLAIDWPEVLVYVDQIVNNELIDF